jgi:hypothetical protein
MSFIDESTISDRHFRYLVDTILTPEQLSVISDEVDDQIITVAAYEQIGPSDIPVDESGFIKSIPFAQYGRLYFKMKMFEAHWGLSNGTEDIYNRKMFFIEKDVLKKEKNLTAPIILGYTATTETEDLTPSDTSRAVPIY